MELILEELLFCLLGWVGLSLALSFGLVQGCWFLKAGVGLET